MSQYLLREEQGQICLYYYCCLTVSHQRVLFHLSPLPLLFLLAFLSFHCSNNKRSPYMNSLSPYRHSAFITKQTP
jgi:hypothetical protein